MSSLCIYCCTYGIQIKGTPGAKFDVKLDNTKISSILIGNDGLGEVKGVAYGDYKNNKILLLTFFFIITLLSY